MKYIPQKHSSPGGGSVSTPLKYVSRGDLLGGLMALSEEGLAQSLHTSWYPTRCCRIQISNLDHPIEASIQPMNKGRTKVRAGRRP